MFTITGPTSSGKTSFALEICKHVKCEIVSADSRQIYKYFDVGTAKVPVGGAEVNIVKNEDCWIINGTPIWMLDVCDPHQIYTVADYKAKAGKIISEIKVRGNIPLIVGGTGFYIDALYGAPVYSPVAPNWALRSDLQDKDLYDLQKMLPGHLLESLNNSDLNNRRRLIRRIEFENAGENRPPNSVANYNFENIAIIKRSREDLYSRADSWCDEIWSPLLSETKALISNGYEDTFPMKGIIYKSAAIFLKENSKMSENDAKQLVKFDLHAYIRRQETWFKKYSNAKIIDISNKNFDDEVRKIVELVQYHEKTSSGKHN